MNKNLILAGVSGNLGKGVLNTLLTKNYDNYIVLMRKGKNQTFNDKRIRIIETGDLSLEKHVKSAFEQIIPDKDTVFYFFSSIGGYMGGKPLWEYSSEDLDTMLKLNLFTGYLVSKYFALLVMESMAGSICLTSAMTSIKTEQKKSIYSLSKSALNSLVKTLSLEGKSINLSVNAIAPYIIDTPDNRDWVKDTSILIKPEEVGEIVHSLFENYRNVSGNIVELKQILNF